jgi:hypothetical protein
MVTPLESWKDKILDDEVVLSVVKTAKGFRAFCRLVGQELPIWRDYQSRPSNDEIKSDFTKDFISKRQKVLVGDDSEIWEAIEKNLEKQEKGEESE